MGTGSPALLKAVDSAVAKPLPDVSASVGLIPEPEDMKLKVTAMPERRCLRATASTLMMLTVEASTASVVATADANADCAAELKLAMVYPERDALMITCTGGAAGGGMGGEEGLGLGGGGGLGLGLGEGGGGGDGG